MSTKGFKQTALTKYKIGLANQKDRTQLHADINEYILTLTPDKIPSIISCAIYAKISESALLHYEARTEDNSEIRQLLTHIRDLNKQYLIENGLRKLIDGRLTTRLLEFDHHMIAQPQNLTQNNVFNVSPEIMAEALLLSKKSSKDIK